MSTTKTLSQMLETFSPRTEHWGLLDKMADMARALEERVAELGRDNDGLSDIADGYVQQRNAATARAEAAEAEVARLRAQLKTEFDINAQTMRGAANSWVETNKALRAKLEKVRAVAAENRNHKQLRVGALAMDILEILDGEGDGE